MSGGEKDEDSAVKRFVDDALQKLQDLRASQLKNGSMPLIPPNPAPTARTSKPVPWLAITALVGPLLAYILGITWTASGSDKTLETVALNVNTMAVDMKALRQDGIDLSIVLTNLAGQVAALRDDNHRMAIQLAELRGMQNQQGLVVVKLQVEVDTAKRERTEIKQAATDTLWTVTNTAKYVSSMKRRVSFLELRAGIEQPEEKGENDG